jgi:chromosome segregation ATPase
MSRRWQYLNFLGVLVLTALCVIQWQRDRRLNLELSRLEKVRQEHELKIAEQEKTARGLTSDLEQFKEQFKLTQADLTETRQRLQAAERENSQLLGERDQLKESITNWAKAVAERDESIQAANAHTTELAGRLNDSIQKFNALATNYNSVVKDLNELRAGSSSQKARTDAAK